MTNISLDAMIERSASDPKRLAHFASVLSALGDAQRAYALAREAIGAAPADSEVRSLASTVLRKKVPGWHFAILRDAGRNGAYDAALRRAVSAHTKVLEIGTGSGIIAMMAARAGARSVVTCEVVRTIADTAREIVALNGYADSVRVINKRSFDLDRQNDLGGPADILVSEIVDNMLIGEGVLPAIEHAHRHLLKRGGRVIPARGSVRVALARDAEFRHDSLAQIDGFNLSPFNRLASTYIAIRRDSPRLSLLSAPADLFDFDFQSGGPFAVESVKRSLVSLGGEANGIVQWIALQMDAEGRYENAPAPDKTSSWAVLFWPFSAPRECPAGSEVEVFGAHDRRRLRIWA